ncbi:MAG: hypothetical protein GEU94_16785 [Micromonosporaceae bacterium]|nr:hypothetical protein [Micromonosporaceae bacterium]
MPDAGAPHAYPHATFTDPTPYGYVHAGFTVDPPRRAPVVRRSKARDNTMARLAALARRFDDLPQVVKATVFRAIFMPPIKGAPRFDVVLLVRTTSPEVISDVQASEPYAELGADSVITAYNSRRIGATEPFAPDVTDAGADAFTSASYLFNHFTAPDPDQAVTAWESLTGWYLAKTGVDNSTLLRPDDSAPYAVINYVRLPDNPPRFLLNQLLRPSFITFVRATLRENGMAALPVFFKPISEAV